MKYIFKLGRFIIPISLSNWSIEMQNYKDFDLLFSPFLIWFALAMIAIHSFHEKLCISSP